MSNFSVLILDGNSLNSALNFQIFQMVIRTCAELIELPSNLSTMQKVPKNSTFLNLIKVILEVCFFHK